MDEGAHQIGDAAQAGAQAGARWAALAVPMGAVLTGGAVLRTAGRVFLGLGKSPGEEDRAPTEQEEEKADRPLWLMLAPCLVLLLLALLPGELARSFAQRAIGGFVHADGATLPAAPAHPWLPWITTALALMVAAFDLGRDRLPAALVRASDRVTNPPLEGLNALHSGVVGDYAAWIAAGLAMLAIACTVM